MHGVHGRAIRVDASDGSASEEAIPDEAFRAVVGGIGLASWLLLRHCPPGVDPLAPEVVDVLECMVLDGTEARGDVAAYVHAVFVDPTIQQ